MKILVVCDSTYGNTEKVASAIAKELVADNDARFLRVTDMEPDDLSSVELLIVGSPTQGGRPTPVMQGFLDKIGQGTLIGVKVASFDTRFIERDQKLPLRILMRTIGYAAEKIMRTLESKGGSRVAEPVGFYVIGREGPLVDGELGRASIWARSLLEK